VIRAALLRRGLPDADAHAQELVGVEVLLDRAQTVVAGEAAADLHPQDRGREVELVVHDDDLVGLDSEASHQPGDGFTRVVHVRERDREREALDVTLEEAADAVEMIVNDGVQAAMNRYNARTPDPA
jgi:dihydroxyacetone kinase